MTSSFPNFVQCISMLQISEMPEQILLQELAFAISMGCEYLHSLLRRGIQTDIAASKIRFSFGTGSEYLPEIAKLRAATFSGQLSLTDSDLGNNSAEWKFTVQQTEQ